MKSREERAQGPEGELPNWLRDQRKAARPDLPNGWKEDETVRRLEAAVPGVSFGAYRDIEAGNRRVTIDQRTAIERVFGPIPDFTHEKVRDPSVDPGLPDLLKLLEDQTKAINALVGVLGPLLVSGGTTLSERLAGVEGRLRLLERPSDATPEDQTPRPATKG